VDDRTRAGPLSTINLAVSGQSLLLASWSFAGKDLCYDARSPAPQSRPGAQRFPASFDLFFYNFKL
jgi:hypothetical protein